MKNYSFKKLLFVLAFIVSIISSHAQQTPEKFVQEMQYLLYLPDGYASDTAKKWPLMIFLHGSGEAGTDLNNVKMHGPPKLIEAGKKFPFIVVSPQAPPRTGWQVEMLKGMLDDLKKKYKVDNDRVYLTGLSMGGFGTWSFAEKFSADLAAIAPICGGGDATKAWTLRHLPVWCFHGAKDDVVPPAASQKMIDSLKKYNSNVKFTLYPDANHNSWDTTYNNEELYTWLLAQKKFRYTPVTVGTTTMQEYTGTYANTNNDTIRIKLDKEKLIAVPGDGEFPLKASSETNFYWDDNSIDEIHFNRDKNRLVSGFTFIGGEIVVFRKIILKKK